MRDGTILNELAILHNKLTAQDQTIQQLNYQVTLNSFRWVALMRILDEKKVVSTIEINEASQKILEEQLKAESEAMAKAKEGETTVPAAADKTEEMLALSVVPPEGNA